MKNIPVSNLPTLSVKAEEDSQWETVGLNPNLIAMISLDPLPEGVTDVPTVKALLEDAEFSLENQYQTPFENSSPETKLPNLMGMIQSGQMLTESTQPQFYLMWSDCIEQK